MQVNLALVAKDFGYASGKSFQKKYAKLKKAHNLTNGHIYGDDKASFPLSIPIKFKLTEINQPETSFTKAPSTEVSQASPKAKETKVPEPEKSVMDIVSEHLKAYSDTCRRAGGQKPRGE